MLLRYIGVNYVPPTKSLSQMHSFLHAVILLLGELLVLKNHIGLSTFVL